MSWRKRLRILLAVFRQDWHTFTCPNCKTDLYICGQAPDMRGMICERCETVEFEKWLVDFRAREKGVA